ncbi:unknown [Clostridium sp. CAG:349]|nr:unknown [Clostridium sp. CAG:349]
MTYNFARPVFAVTLAKHRILVIFRATHSMSLRAQRGNRRERTPCYKTHARYLYLRGKKHSLRLAGINCLMELSRLNVIELTNLALSVATILTRDLTVSETECLLKFLCIVRDDISLILCDKRTGKS